MQAGAVCRAAVSECDREEVCDGTELSCPADTFAESGMACGPDGEVCADGQCVPPGDGCAADPSGCRGSRVMAGGLHSGVVQSDGTLRMWGNGRAGQLGIGATLDWSGPVQVPGLDSVVSLVGGASYTCALRAQGDVLCWGWRGVLGYGDGSADALGPAAPVPGLEGVVELAGGWSHACARTQGGEVWCWGRGDSGELGDGLATDSPVPVQVSVTDARSLTAGSGFSCAVVGDGAVDCWGRGFSGQFPGSGSMADRAEPERVSGITDAVEIAAGDSHICALRASGQAVCWGANTVGQLGDGSEGSSGGITRVIDAQGASAIRAGGSFSCAILAEGEAICWGHNAVGQLGGGTRSTAATPTSVVDADGVPLRFEDVSLGEHHACGRERGTGRVLCWGDNSMAQVSQPPPGAVLVPTPVEL